jgi:hypothetical protein
MRDGDAAEARALGMEPGESLDFSLSVSSAAFALELGGELAALFGVAPGPRRAALARTEYDWAWMLSGRAVERHVRAFWCESKRVMAELRRAHPLLVAMVDARYEASLRWAWRLGGELLEPVPLGPSGMPFHPVIWRSPWACR